MSLIMSSGCHDFCLLFCAAEHVQREQQVQSLVDPLPHGMGGHTGGVQCKPRVPTNPRIGLPIGTCHSCYYYTPFLPRGKLRTYVSSL